MNSIIRYFTITLIVFSLACMLTSCKKDKEVCAKCFETVSQFHADDYCDTPDMVDWYVENLKDQGAAVGQNWICTIE